MHVLHQFMLEVKNKYLKRTLLEMSHIALERVYFKKIKYNQLQHYIFVCFISTNIKEFKATIIYLTLTN